MSCSHKGIPPIVTLTTVNHDGAGSGKKLPDTAGNPLTRNLHESGRSYTESKDGFLGIFHLLGCQDHSGGKGYNCANYLKPTPRSALTQTIQKGLTRKSLPA